MSTLQSPIAGPAGWTLTLPGTLAIPAGLRYAGSALFELRAERTTTEQLRMPADGALRAVTPATGRTFLEIEVNPFALRHVAQQLAFGLPTFYLVLDAGVLPVAFEPGDIAPAGERLADVAAVSVLCAGQDRVARDPALWSGEILAAITAASAGDDGWRPFAEAVASQTAGGANPPVLLLDHRGAARASATVRISSSAGSATALMTPADGGDLQRTVTRMHADDPGAMTLDSVFGAGGGPVTLRPLSNAPGDVQLAAIEGAGALSAAGEIALTPSSRHVAFTDLTSWFAPQFAAPPSPFQRLARFTRGNAVTAMVNGIEYYDHLFRRLHDAVLAEDEGGLHLAGGWQTFPDVKLAQRPAAGDPYAAMPATLEQAATWIGTAGGRTRFLSPKFFQLDSGSVVEQTEIIAFSFIVFGLLRAKGTKLVRSDAGGSVILIALFIANAIFVTWLIATDGRAIEPNKDAVEILDAIDGAESRYAPHPARVETTPTAQRWTTSRGPTCSSSCAPSAPTTRSSRS